MKTYLDISGDGGSEVVEQLSALHVKISQNLSQFQNIVAVGSGKGGVGKSTCALQLALALQMRGHRVTILDADFNGPSIGVMSGAINGLCIPTAKGLSIPRTVDGVGILSLGSFLGDREALDFESVSSGDGFVWRATREFSMLAQLLSSVNFGDSDTLIVDLPPGPERTAHFIEFLGESVKLILVTMSSQVSVGVVARSISALKKRKNAIIGYIENMCGYLCPGCKTIQPLFPALDAEQLSLPVLGKIPFDPELAAACDSGLTIQKLSSLMSFASISKVVDNVLVNLGEHNEIPLREMR